MMETERLLLRPWQESDAEALYRWASDPEVGPAAGWSPHTSVENSRDIIRTVLSEEGTFAVVPKDGNGDPIGAIGVFPTEIPEGRGEPEIGYCIARPYWGQGLIPEAVEAMLRRQFREMGAERVWCAHFPGNERSRRVQEKCGFRHVCDTPRRRGPTERSIPACARPLRGRSGRCAMADGFRIPFQEAESEFVEKRSRFISHVWRVETEEEAQARIQETKKKYYDARHNCWCYLLGANLVRYSDDGEPQGTAGQPMLNVFQRENVTGAVCVVTRYFGGILLGAGGLTRAYSKGARDALAAAGVATMGLWARVRLSCPYPLFERVKLEIAAASGILDDMDYGADVTLTVSLPSERRETLQGRLTELSAGGLTLALMEESYRPGPREEL